MEAAKRTLPDPDLIFWTGDAPAHDIWAYSKGSFSNLCFFMAIRLDIRLARTSHWDFSIFDSKHLRGRLSGWTSSDKV